MGELCESKRQAGQGRAGQDKGVRMRDRRGGRSGWMGE